MTNPQATAEQLRCTDSRDAGRDLIAKLTTAQLRQVAEHLGMRTSHLRTKPELVEGITEYAIGSRLNSRAIRAL